MAKVFIALEGSGYWSGIDIRNFNVRVGDSYRPPNLKEITGVLPCDTCVANTNDNRRLSIEDRKLICRTTTSSIRLDLEIECREKTLDIKLPRKKHYRQGKFL